MTKLKEKQKMCWITVVFEDLFIPLNKENKTKSFYFWNFAGEKKISFTYSD